MPVVISLSILLAMKCRFTPFVVCLLLSVTVMAQRQMENLGRGVVAVRNDKGQVFVSWRLLGTDAGNLAFNVYRANTKLNKKPIAAVTHFVDTTAAESSAYTYSVKPVVNGKEQRGGSFTLQPGNASYLSISLQTPPGYAPNDGSETAFHCKQD